MIDTLTTNNKKINQSLGNLTDLKKVKTGIEGVTTNGIFKINIYDKGIIQIHINFNGDYDYNPYSVIASPISDFKVDDTNDCITLATDKLKLEISKSPVRFSFKTLEGKIINQDDEYFGTSCIGEQVTTYKKLQDNERFIGLGEKTGPLDRRGNGYQHWNTDHFGYGASSDPLYCSTPFYIGLHNELSYGIYLDNPHKSHFNFGASNDRFSSFSADTGDMNYYFIYDDNVAGILKLYGHLTGYMPMPPIWSLGYQQCRYSYYPDVEVTRIAQTFRNKDIPADVIVLDIHYMEHYKIFTWDNQNFPNPAELISHLKNLGFHVVVMCDPGIKIEADYEVYESGLDKDVFVKYPDGTNYSGSVWPGLCHFPDFTNQATRNWWAEKLKLYTDIGIDGFWNDMNEIATWGQMLPELIEFDFEGNKATARKGRNVYGLQMSRASYEGAKINLKGKRPFNLTRAGFSGIQRYAAVWTGDNVASDEHMMVGVRLVNSMGLAGIAFAGYDVGGFAGNASEHLFARWVQIGAFSPFFRGHSMINSRDAEPWAYGEEVEEISRNYIKLRYKLMPYLYSSFYEATQTGIPIARSLAIDYSHDDNIYSSLYENQYLFGQSILIAPVESYKELAKVYLPSGKWFEFFTDQKYEGNVEIVAECGIERLPVFVKAGAIIPLCPNAKTNSNGLGDIMEIHVYQGDEYNEFLYYEDDGESYEFESGHYYQRLISYSPEKRKLTIEKKAGDIQSKIKELKICFHGFDNHIFKLDNNSIVGTKEAYRFIDPISNFDPFENKTASEGLITNIQTITTENRQNEIEISW
ncbi:MAG TPA: glycoside hydrolase family 31 protein [Fulvivirga sp.]|nr:glycoside hydrolase family 31 protein [Fulvivirga sp.]